MLLDLPAVAFLGLDSRRWRARSCERVQLTIRYPSRPSRVIATMKSTIPFPQAITSPFLHALEHILQHRLKLFEYP